MFGIGLNTVASNGRGVVSMSLGFPITYSIDDAVQKLMDSNYVVSVAAGNSNANACNYSPAHVQGVSITFISPPCSHCVHYLRGIQSRGGPGSCLTLWLPWRTFNRTTQVDTNILFIYCSCALAQNYVNNGSLSRKLTAT